MIIIAEILQQHLLSTNWYSFLECEVYPDSKCFAENNNTIQQVSRIVPVSTCVPSDNRLDILVKESSCAVWRPQKNSKFFDENVANDL